MQIIIDTSYKDFFIVLLDKNNNILKKVILKNLTKKVEQIPLYFQNFLSEFKMKISDIENVFVCVGPGRFTGARVALLFFQSIYLFHKFNFYSFNSFAFLKNSNLIDARGKQAYILNKKTNEISLIDVEQEIQFEDFDYDYFLSNFNEFKGRLKPILDVINLKPIYVKNPQIGGQKC